MNILIFEHTKIHKTKIHKNKCEVCDVHFENQKQLERHMLSDATLAHITEISSEEFGFEIKHYHNDECCLGVVNLTKQREDKSPVLFLHCQECWGKSFHCCEDLPEPGDYENDYGALVDYNQYDQTVHVLMDDMVDKNMDKQGFTMEWSRMNRVIKDYA